MSQFYTNPQTKEQMISASAYDRLNEQWDLESSYCEKYGKYPFYQKTIAKIRNLVTELIYNITYTRFLYGEFLTQLQKLRLIAPTIANDLFYIFRQNGSLNYNCERFSLPDWQNYFEAAEQDQVRDFIEFTRWAFIDFEFDY